MNDPVRFEGDTALVVVRQLSARCREVWEYFVDPERRQKWFCAGETGSAMGEPFVMAFDHRRIAQTAPPPGMTCGEAVEIRGEILEFEPPHRLSYRWPSADGPDSIVTITLEPIGDDQQETRLTLRHERLSQGEDRFAAAAGWHAHLALLGNLIASREVPDFWAEYAQAKRLYPPTTLQRD